MELRFDDSLLDPDLFIKSALEQRIEAINKQLERIARGESVPDSREALIAARTRFAEALKPYRRPSAAAVPAAVPAAAARTSAAAPQPMAPAAEPPMSAEKEAPPAPVRRGLFILPDAAIPKPRRFAEPVQAEPQRPPPKRREEAPKSGMVSFLKSIQSKSKEQVIPSLASNNESQMIRTADLDNEPGDDPSPASREPSEPSAPRPAVPPPQKGGMLAYLQTMRANAPAPKPEIAAEADDIGPAEADNAEPPAAPRAKSSSTVELSSELKGLLDELD